MSTTISLHDKGLNVITIVCYAVNVIKYTWAPQTVHNTPVMNILKSYFY